MVSQLFLINSGSVVFVSVDLFLELYSSKMCRAQPHVTAPHFQFRVHLRN